MGPVMFLGQVGESSGIFPDLSSPSIRRQPSEREVSYFIADLSRNLRQAYLLLLRMVAKCLVLMCVAVSRISSLPNGAPEGACLNMSPGEEENAHGAKPQPQSSTPYKVKVQEDYSKVHPGVKIYLLLKGERNIS